MSKAIKHIIVVVFMIFCAFFFLFSSLILWSGQASPAVHSEKLPEQLHKVIQPSPIVGDKMPSLEEYEVTGSDTWVNPDYTRGGPMVLMVKPGEHTCVVVWNDCDGVTADLPFGIFNPRTDTLYLDNNPTDGYIDEVVINPTGYVYEEAPACNEGKSG